MTKPLPCPECGKPLPADAPQGLCPKCLALSAIGSSPDASAAEELRLTHIGDYELESKIAQGGMGVVYRARQISLNRPVALKMILAGPLANPAEIKRFRAEAEIVASLTHPHIVEIFEVGDYEGLPFFSMRFVEGANLADWAARRPSGMPVRETVDLMVKVAGAVHYAHQRGILHRDLKPGNILIDAQGEPHITDFGLARQIESPSDLTVSGSVLGSPSFMSPEQATGHTKRLTTSADIYSLGAILYFLLTGRPPFAGATALETTRQLMDREPEKPTMLNPRTPRDLETICLKCLEKDTKRRYASADAVAEDLERWIRCEPILARRVATWERIAKWVQRRPAVSGALACAALAASAAIIGIGWQWRVAEAERQLVEAEKRHAQKSEQDATDRLRESYLAQARANRLTATPGQRFGSLDILKKAAAIHPGDDLRDEAIACLANDDLRLVRTNKFDNSSFVSQPDDAFEQYAMEFNRKEIVILRLSDNRELARLPTAAPLVDEGLVFSHERNWLIAHYSDRQVRVWDLKRKVVLLSQVAPKFYQAVSFRRDDMRLAVANGESDIKIYELPTGRLLHSWRTSIPPERVVYSPDGRWLAVAGDGNPVLIFNAETGELISQLSNPIATIALAWNPDSAHLAVAAHNRYVYYWQALTGKKVHELSGHGEEIGCLEFHPAGDLLLSGGYDGIMLWDLASGARRLAIPISCAGLKLSTDGGRLYIKTHSESDFILGEMAHGNPVRHFGSQERFDGPRPLAFSPDAHWLTFLDTHCLRWLAPSTGRDLAQTDRGSISGLGFDGGTNLWTWGDGTVNRQRLSPGDSQGSWRLEAPRPVPELAGSIPRAFSPEGRFLAMICGGQICLVDLASMREYTSPLHFPGANLLGTPLAVSPDGQSLALGFLDRKEVWLYGTQTTNSIMQFRRSFTFASVHGALPQFFPDGQRLVIHWGLTLGVYDIASEQPLWSRPIEDLGVCALSPNGQCMAVREGKRFIRLLDAATGNLLATFESPNGFAIRQLVFNPDGTVLAAATEAVCECFVWDLRSIHTELAKLGLTGSWPSFPCQSPAAVPLSLTLASGGGSSSPLSPPSGAEADTDSVAATQSHPLDLSRFVNVALDETTKGDFQDNNLVELKPGIHRFNGIEFDVRGRVQLRGQEVMAKSYPYQAIDIPVGMTCRRLHFAMAVVHAAKEGERVGRLVMQWADGAESSLPLVYDRNISDWWHSPKPGNHELRTAWAGRNALTPNLRLFEIIWENPKPDNPLKSFSFYSDLNLSAPFLVAVTAETSEYISNPAR